MSDVNGGVRAPDPFVISAVEDLCGLLCSNPDSLAAFRKRALPALLAVLGSPTQQEAIVLTVHKSSRSYA